MNKNQPNFKNDGLPELVAGLVVLLWASTFPLTSWMYNEFLPLAFGGLRMIVITLLAFTSLLVHSRLYGNRGILPIARRDIPLFIIVGLFGYTGYQLGFLIGLQHTSPFSGALMIYLLPLVTLMIVTVMGERHPWFEWVGAMIAIVGVGIFLFQLQGESRLVGNLISLAGGSSFAMYQVLGRPLVRAYAAPTFAAWSALFGAIPLVLISMPSMARQDWSAVSNAGWLSFAYMSVFPVYVAYMLWGWVVSRRGVEVSGLVLLVPVVAGLLSWLFLGEGFNANKLVGAMVTVLGLVVMQRDKLRKYHH